MQKPREFLIPLPENSEGLRARFNVMAYCTEMVKMRYNSNAKLQTASIEHFTEYVNDLCGPMIWGFVTKGPDGVPKSSPHI